MASFDYSYLPCQFCVGKNHCEQCGEDICRALLAMDGVADVRMDVPARKLTVEMEPGADVDDVVDGAEALGVFL